MSFRGTMRNGRVELEPGVQIPDGTELRVEPVRRSRGKGRSKASAAGGSVYRLYELAVPMGVRDLAAEHDHYLYGTPKRSARKRKSAPRSSGSRKRTPRGRR